MLWGCSVRAQGPPPLAPYLQRPSRRRCCGEEGAAHEIWGLPIPPQPVGVGWAPPAPQGAGWGERAGPRWRASVPPWSPWGAPWKSSGPWHRAGALGEGRNLVLCPQKGRGILEHRAPCWLPSWGLAPTDECTCVSFPGGLNIDSALGMSQQGQEEAQTGQKDGAKLCFSPASHFQQAAPPQLVALEVFLQLFLWLNLQSLEGNSMLRGLKGLQQGLKGLQHLQSLPRRGRSILSPCSRPRTEWWHCWKNSSPTRLVHGLLQVFCVQGWQICRGDYS